MNRSELQITTIIPSTGKRASLLTSIQSAAEQSAEVIVVLNGEEINDKIVSNIHTSSKIKLIQINKKIGIGAARQAGIEIATNDYIAFLDDDDFFLPERNSKMLFEIISKKLDLVMCNSVWISPNGCKILPGKKIQHLNLISFMLSFSPTKGSGIFSASTIIISRDYLRKLPWCLSEKVEIQDLHEDMHWAIKAQNMGINWSRLNLVGTVVVRNSPESVSDKFKEFGRFEKETEWLLLNSNQITKNQKRKFKLHHIFPVQPKIGLMDVIAIFQSPWSGLLGIRRRLK